MSVFQTIVLALIQGATEFLPVSSSAHLILVPYLLGWEDQGLRFDVATNTGTLLAVVLYFRRDLAELLGGARESLRRSPRRWDFHHRLVWILALATVPVGLAGLIFYDWIAGPLRHPLVIATTSIFFALLLAWADRAGRRQRPLESVSWMDGFFVGLTQALALIPGTSRSGITITAGLAAGLTRRAAARFAFLLAIPAGALAGVKDVWELAAHPVPAQELGLMVLALAVSAVSAYLVIGWLLSWLQRRGLGVFVLYRILLGLFLIVTYLLSG